MATTLLDLRPTGDGTVTGMTVVGGSGTFASAVTDDPDTNDGDASYITSGIDSAGDLYLLLTDMPGAFLSVDALVARIAVRLNGTATDDSTTLLAQVFAADQTTPLTEEVQVASDADTGGTYTVRTATFTTINSPTSKATWDGARLHLRWTYTKNMASDGIALRVSAVEVASTLTTATTITAAASGAASTSGSALASKILGATASGAAGTAGSATARRLEAPTATLELWEGGVLVSNLGTVEIPSTGAQAFDVTWDASLLSNTRGSNVELRIVMTPTGEGATGEVGAIEWGARGQVTSTTEVSASGASTTSGSAALSTTQSASASGAAVSSGAVSAARVLRATVSGGSSSVGSAAGAVPARVLSAAGTSLSSGAAVAARALAGSAAGASVTLGTVTGTRNIAVSATGASLTSGGADAVRGLAAVASGGSVSAGSARPLLHLTGASAGTANTSGSASADVPARVVSAAGSSVTSGSALAAISGLSASATGASVTLGAVTATRTRISAVPPDGVAAAVNIGTTHTLVDEDPDFPDAGWLEAVDPEAPTDIRLTFAAVPLEVGEVLVEGAGRQEFRIRVRAAA